MKRTIIILLLLLPLAGFAQEFVPLVGVPGLDDSNDFGGYVNALYILAISIAAFLAVVKIIFGGVKYMMSDVVTTKGEAKKDIQGALVGLLIVLGAFLILETINPQLNNLNVFRSADPINSSATGFFDLVFPTDSSDPTSAITNCTGTYVINEQYPTGACITASSELEDDYTDSPGEGQVACGSNLTYNPNTNSCEEVIVTEPIGGDGEQGDEFFNNYVENQGCELDDTECVNEVGRQYCNQIGQRYVEAERACTEI